MSVNNPYNSNVTITTGGVGTSTSGSWTTYSGSTIGTTITNTAYNLLNPAFKEIYFIATYSDGAKEVINLERLIHCYYLYNNVSLEPLKGEELEVARLLYEKI